MVARSRRCASPIRSPRCARCTRSPRRHRRLIPCWNWRRRRTFPAGRRGRPSSVPPNWRGARRARPRDARRCCTRIAHIEFNAINLALDAVWRFGGMPQAYYRDWLRVADEEATHFSLLGERLAAHRGEPTATLPRTMACGRWRRRTAGRRPRPHGAGAPDARGARARCFPGDPREARRGRRRSVGAGHRRDPARRDRARGDREPVVPLSLRAARRSTSGRPTPNCPPSIGRRACMARSTCRHAARPGSTRTNCARSSPDFPGCRDVLADASRISRTPRSPSRGIVSPAPAG